MGKKGKVVEARISSIGHGKSECERDLPHGGRHRCPRFLERSKKHIICFGLGNIMRWDIALQNSWTESRKSRSLQIFRELRTFAYVG